MPVHTYDPGQVVVTWAVEAGGEDVTISGYADGTFVSVERTNDAFTKVVGADGEVTRIRSRDRSGTVTLTLTQTSNSNVLLQAAARRDEQSAPDQVFLLQIKDLSGFVLVEAKDAWIRKAANVEFGTDLGNREWAFDAGEINFTELSETV